jgi:hypothetical protein
LKEAEVAVEIPFSIVVRGDDKHREPPSRSTEGLGNIGRSIIGIIMVSINIIITMYFQTMNIVMHPTPIGIMESKKLLHLVSVQSCRNSYPHAHRGSPKKSMGGRNHHIGLSTDNHTHPNRVGALPQLKVFFVNQESSEEKNV